MDQNAKISIRAPDNGSLINPAVVVKITSNGHEGRRR
jgi:hypothetical protein